VLYCQNGAQVQPSYGLGERCRRELKKQTHFCILNLEMTKRSQMIEENSGLSIVAELGSGAFAPDTPSDPVSPQSEGARVGNAKTNPLRTS
jgi:hypothetical protein